ncbi:MAG: stage III sporulation protein AE [Bacillota bacterium]|nr:stage III sporulation protein AE [Bacillota bacterium]
MRGRTGFLVLALIFLLGAAPPFDPLPDPAEWGRENVRENPWLGVFADALQGMENHGGPSLEELDSYLQGKGWSWQPLSWVQSLMSAFLGEGARAALQVAGLLLLALLGSLLLALRQDGESGAMAAAADLALYLLLAALALASFYGAVEMAVGVVLQLRDLLLAALPLLISLLASSGALLSAGLLHPILLFLVHTLLLAVAQGVLPVLFLSVVAETLSHLPGTFSLQGLAALLRQGALGFLGLSLVVFLGIVSIQGYAGAVADGLGLRTAKYAASTFIPVLGGVFSDATELVLSAGQWLRTGVGLVGLVAVVTFLAYPLMKLLALILVYRLGAAFLEPLGSVPASRLFATMAEGLTSLTLAVGAASLLGFLALGATLLAGSMTAMLR